VAGRAHGAVAALRRAATQRVRDRGMHGRRGRAQDLRGMGRQRRGISRGRGDGARGAEPDGRRQAGKKARERAQEMKGACRKAVEEGGSSYTATQKLERDMLASYVPGKQ
jgi:hypothetical protein